MAYNEPKIVTANATIQFVDTISTKTLNFNLSNLCLGSSLTHVTTALGNCGFGAGCLGQITTSTNCVAIGSASLSRLTTGTGNTSIGSASSAFLLDGVSNTSVGSFSLEDCVSGNYNCAFGRDSLTTCTSSQNSAFGTFSLTSITTGNNNVVFGYAAGTNYTSSESSNILIGNLGVLGESNAIRIGTQGAGAGQQNTCAIAGITGNTITGAAVLCDTSGNLGTIVSSKRYKENIQEIPKDVSVMNLTPVTFNYIKDKSKTTQYGLIAEEVHDKFPYLCLYRDGEPDTVKYHELCTFLLIELQRLNARIEVLEGKV